MWWPSRRLARLQNLALYLADALLVPAVSLVVFTFLLGDLNKIFQVNVMRKKSSSPGKLVNDWNWRMNVYDDFVYRRISDYVTDDMMDFLISAEPCLLPTQHGDVHSAKGDDADYDGLFLISTSASHLENRRIFRHLYSLQDNTRPYRIKVVFLVGRSTDLIVQANIEREDYQYRDMVQGNFFDHYSNLTFKTIMGYRWARLYCRKVKVILKMDDDVYLDVFKFFDYFLPMIPRRRRTIYGFLNRHPKVFREGKYKVGVDEFAKNVYPDFTSGFFIVPTPDIIDELYEVSKITRFVHLEDVFIYGLVREAMTDVQLVHLDTITYEWKVYKDCVSDHEYRCKFMAVESLPSDLLSCYDQVIGVQDDNSAYLEGSVNETKPSH
ncbi:Beta-1,3-galactosyltransferase 1 [Bulinus truncatus]|nr:Beta-1,3-galactosyltransferase 1 [Bulinus truncatus]